MPWGASTSLMPVRTNCANTRASAATQNSPGQGAGQGLMADLTLRSGSFHCAGTAIADFAVDVCDRGADDYEAMCAALAVGHHFLIRAAQNRLVFVAPAQHEQAYVLDYARSLPSVGT